MPHARLGLQCYSARIGRLLCGSRRGTPGHHGARGATTEILSAVRDRAFDLGQLQGGRAMSEEDDAARMKAAAKADEVDLALEARRDPVRAPWQHACPECGTIHNIKGAAR